MQSLRALEAGTIGVAVDERKGHLLGILADMQDTGKNAAHMAQAIHKAVEIFCSPRREHPGMNPVLREPGPQDKADAAQAKQRILKRIEMVSADGASNGQVAARMMHPKVGRSCADVVELPFLKIVVIDKAHSSRRIPDRTLRHPAMTTILKRVMLNPDSVAHTLQYSEQLFGMFQKEWHANNGLHHAKCCLLICATSALRSSALTVWPNLWHGACGIWMP